MLLTVMVGAQTAGADEGAPKLNASAGSAANVSGRSRLGKCSAKHRGKRSGKMLGWPVSDKELLAEQPAPPSGNLHIISLNYKDEAKVNIYNLGTDEWCRVNDSVGWICQSLKLDPKREYSGGERGWVGDSPFIYLDTWKVKI